MLFPSLKGRERIMTTPDIEEGGRPVNCEGINDRETTHWVASIIEMNESDDDGAKYYLN